MNTNDTPLPRKIARYVQLARRRGLRVTVEITPIDGHNSGTEYIIEIDNEEVETSTLLFERLHVQYIGWDATEYRRASLRRGVAIHTSTLHSLRHLRTRSAIDFAIEYMANGERNAPAAAPVETVAIDGETATITTAEGVEVVASETVPVRARMAVMFFVLANQEVWWME